MTTRVVNPEQMQALTVQEHGDVPAVMEEMSFAQLAARLTKIRAVVAEVLTPGVDFGIVPGTSRIVDGVEQAKPALYKSGAEKMGALFLFAPKFENTLTYSGPDSNQHLTVTSECSLTHIPTQRFVASGSGMCSTRESKYASRRGGLKCPKCNTENLIHTKRSPTDWWCSSYKGGCGENFPADFPAIATQERGTVANEKLADSYNTVLKMGEKRSHVAAIIRATGASDLLTQDLEDMSEDDLDTIIRRGEAALAKKQGGDTKTETGTGAPEKKKTTPNASKGAKAAQGAANGTPTGDRITAEQAQEFAATCTELGYDPEEVLANYRQYDKTIEKPEDLLIGMFKNFQQAAAKKRAAQESKGDGA